MDLISKEDLLNALKQHGPLIPMDIRKYLGKGDSITIGAALSELAQYNQIRITNVKKGGSPFYYVSGQEHKLQELSQYLNEKDRRTYELLKEKKVVRDKTQEPLTRVSLRMIKDFSKPVNVDTRDGEEIFWKWYLLSDEEALKMIREFFLGEKPVRRKEAEEHEALPSSEEATPKKEVEKAVKEAIKEPAKHSQETIPAPDILAEATDPFSEKLKNFFEERKIRIKDSNVVRKSSEYEFIVEINTPVGAAEYFCKAKKKKKCGDGDLSTAYLKGQNKRLPVLFITDGEIAKKTKEKLKTEYKGMIIQEI